MSEIIDVHCHIFNADDVPIKGMLKARNFPDWFAKLLDAILQKLAPSGDRVRGTSYDKTEINDELLDTLIREAVEEDADIMNEIGKDYDIEPLTTVRGATPFGFISWLKTMVKSNHQIAQILIDQFDTVDLFVPLVLDMELWLKDETVVPYDKQIQNIGNVCKNTNGKLHPFVPFDPMRQVLAEKDQSGTVITPLDMVKEAVEKYGYIGVKVYPAMGYLPFDNANFLSGLPDKDKLDAAFEKLFLYCENNGVPITTHCSPGGAEAYERSGQWGHPSYWKPVLKQHPALRINFAHFGGGKETLKDFDHSWAWDIAKLMNTYPNVYSDTGYFACLSNERDREKYSSFFTSLYAEYPIISERLMYGSDWEMICVEKGQKDYLTSLCEAFEDMYKTARAPASAFDNLFGLNAKRFLGLSDGPNRKRLLSFYSGRKYPSWLS
jgi:predicted TIM-barrel fold metal-dependent hydrolase